MKKILFFCILPFFALLNINAQEKVTVSGQITDFEGNPVDSAMVEIFNKDYSTSLSTHTNKAGRYSISVPKGKYIAMGGMRMDEYPIMGSVLPEEDQRLEFWAYNILADEDIEVNARYHRLEVYGINVFRVQGGYPAYAIYFRPMSLTRYFSFPAKDRPIANLAPPKEHLDVEVYFDNEPVTVRSIQEIEEYVDMGKCTGYLLFVDLPKHKNVKSYREVKIVATDKENGDKGESFYFMEKEGYE